MVYTVTDTNHFLPIPTLPVNGKNIGVAQCLYMTNIKQNKSPGSVSRIYVKIVTQSEIRLI